MLGFIGKYAVLNHIQRIAQQRSATGRSDSYPGIGGLGHLGIQFARKSGFITAAIGRGEDKQDLALSLGAAAYIDTKKQDFVKELQKLGGARVILATAPDARAMGGLVDGLAPGGKLVVVGASTEPFSITSVQLLLARKSIMGWPSGTSIDSEDALKFAAASGVRPMIKTFPLERTEDAYNNMITGRVRFRSVLKM